MQLQESHNSEITVSSINYTIILTKGVAPGADLEDPDGQSYNIKCSTTDVLIL